MSSPDNSRLFCGRCFVSSLAKVCLFVAVMLASASVVGAADGDGEDLGWAILWSDAEAVFLPAAIVEEAESLDQLPISESLRRLFEIMIERETVRRSQPGYQPNCSSRSWPDEPQRDVSDALRSLPIAVTGTVVHRIPGWSRKPVVAVFLEVDSVVKGSQYGLRPGDMVTLFKWGAEASIMGLQFCTEDSAHQPVTAGERLLVIGRPGIFESGVASSHIQAFHTFGLSDGNVQPASYGGLTVTSPQSLEAIVDASLEVDRKVDQ